MSGYTLKFRVTPEVTLEGEECEYCGAPHGEYLSRVVGNYLEWRIVEPGTPKRRGVDRNGIPCTWSHARRVDLSPDLACQTCLMMQGR